MILRGMFFLILVVLSSSCAQNFTKEETSLCKDLGKIKVVPFKGEKVNDKIYNKLIFSGEKAIPCLLEKMVDTNIMSDPRKAPPYEGFVVGDIAFFLLLNITKTDLGFFLPDEVKDEYGENGIYAYFEYVEDKKKRMELQSRARDFLKDKRVKK